jgi:serine/threonine protein kinase
VVSVTDPLTSAQTSIGRTGPGALVGGRYVLRAAVGHGGMGTVWRGTDTQLNRNVAVKEVVPPPGIAPEDRDAMHERMLREARAAALLSHPGVVQVYDVVTDGDRPWIVMELLDARSLSDIVLEDGPLGARAVAKIGVTLLGALEVAHAAGILHRDVKPANVLVCTDGRCVLTDFGVARMPTDQQLTTPGMVLGSPHFISPERALGAAFGPPSDLFSLGVTLYCAVEGRPPFDKGEPIATMHSVVEDQPLPPQHAGVLTEVLYGLLEKDPDLRWDATRARQALRDLLAGPLASRTPQFPTDPYAMVPSQRLPWQGGEQRQIGGRALLNPGERPTDRRDPYREVPDPYRQLPDAYGGQPDATFAGAPPLDTASAGAPEPDTSPYGANHYRANPYDANQYDANPYDANPYDANPYDANQYDANQYDANQYRANQYRANQYRATRRGAAHSAGEGMATALSDTGARALAAARRTPRRAVAVAAAGALAVLLLATSIWLVAGDGEGEGEGGGEPPSAQDPTAEPTAAPGDEAPFPVQAFIGHGVQVNLPASWQELERTAIRVDFEEPEIGEVALLRLLAEPAGGDSRKFVADIAEPNIKKNCDAPYSRVDIIETELDGHAATQLEYTCGSGDRAQHTLWVTTVRDGMAYSFFLRLPERQFDEHRIIFDELVRSFEVVGA